MRERPLPAAFTDPDQVELGAVVFDRDSQRPAVVHWFRGVTVTLIRPAGATWDTPYGRLRPATADEHRQLEALAKFQRIRRRAMPRTPGRRS